MFKIRIEDDGTDRFFTTSIDASTEESIEDAMYGVFLLAMENWGEEGWQSLRVLDEQGRTLAGLLNPNTLDPTIVKLH